MTSQQRSRVVFVGNLPFDHTEEQLVEVFNSVGPVTSFRLVFDHATGKPKGFGFCEYKDPETAASALRNLQGVEVGGRGLRLDFADTDDSPPSKRTGGTGGNGIGDVKVKPLPVGVGLGVGGSATDSISKTLATMPPGQLLDIMSQMKALVTTSPFEAKTLLTSNPQLTYALFQAMLMMNIVDAGVLQKMLPQSATPAPLPSTSSPYGTSNSNTYNGRSGPTPNSNSPMNFNRDSNAGNYSRDGGRENYNGRDWNGGDNNGGGGGRNEYGGGNGNGNSRDNDRYGPPASHREPLPPPPAAAPVPDQAAAIAQVLAMTQSQIDALPAESRNIILQIRAQAAAAMGGGRR